jgi:hypothetical protein
MKIDSVKQNYHTGYSAYKKGSNNTQAPSYSVSQNSPSFTGNKLTETQELFLNLFPKMERRLYNIMTKVSDYAKGEVGGIVINAIGTGAVAPWFIAFNPFVKAKPDATPEEKEEVSKTKKYTAMRQPVSAALAILIQVGVQKPIDKFLQNVTNNPDISKYFKGWVLNQASLQDEKYITRQINKGNIKLKENETVKDAVARIKQEQVDAIVKTLADEGKIKMGKFDIDNAAVAEVLNNRIDDYIASARDQQIDNPHYRKYIVRAAELHDNEKILKGILGKEALSKLPKLKDGSVDPKELKNYLREQRKNAPNIEVKRILNEIVHDMDSTRESLCTRTIERIQKIKDACNQHYSMDKYRDYLKEFNETYETKIKDLEALKIENVKTAKPEEIQEVIKKLVSTCSFDDKAEGGRLSKIFRDSGDFKPVSNWKDLETKVYEDVVKSYKEFVGLKYGIFKQLSKVAVGVAVTLPITCYALNWVYPRFMDIFFPSLGKSNTEAKTEQTGKGGNK